MDGESTDPKSSIQTKESKNRDTFKVRYLTSLKAQTEIESKSKQDTKSRTKRMQFNRLKSLMGESNQDKLKLKSIESLRNSVEVSTSSKGKNDSNTKRKSQLNQTPQVHKSS